MRVVCREPASRELPASETLQGDIVCVRWAVSCRAGRVEARGAPPDAEGGNKGYVVSVDFWIDRGVRLEEVVVPANVVLSSGGEIGAFVAEHDKRRKRAAGASTRAK